MSIHTHLWNVRKADSTPSARKASGVKKTDNYEYPPVSAQHLHNNRPVDAMHGAHAPALAAGATYEALQLRSTYLRYWIRMHAMPDPTNSRNNTGPSEGPLSSWKQPLCLFACSTSLPAPFRAVSTWYTHKRDQPNNISSWAAVKLSYPVRTTDT